MSQEVIWGRQAVTEAMRAGRRRLRTLYIARGIDERGIEEILSMARDAGAETSRVPRESMDRRAPDAVHQGVVGVFDAYPYVDVREILRRAAASHEDPLVVVAANIEDPHNLGSILRTADCAGAHGVILPRRRACGVTPAVVRVSSGASEHMAVARVTNLVRTVEELKEERLWIYGAEADGDSIYETDLARGVALCFGAEGSGLPRLLRDRCDGLVSIPLRGRVHSLNVGVAAGIAIYEAIRQRRDASRCVKRPKNADG